jgi:glycosyltransferase involved in cell wall biosynthesis
MLNNLNSDKSLIINGRFLCNSMNGIGRFSLEICKQLKRLGLNFKIVIPEWLNYDNEHGFEIVKYGNFKSHFWEQIDLLRFLKLKKSPFLLNLSGLGPIFYKKQIVTIHDLSFYENSKWFSKAYTLFYSYFTPITAKNAIKILTVSYFSKNEIIKYLDVDKRKIEVIYNAVSANIDDNFNECTANSVIKYDLNCKYILAVSSIDPRKNLQLLIDAFLELNLDNYKLVLVGKTSNHFNVKLKANSRNIIFTGLVSDIDLSMLYKSCEFFVYPSLYEGFGIPPLEAMKNHCAVILSDIPSLREICNDAALYINPNDINDLKNGMLKVIKDPTLKEDLKIKGFSRSNYFKWETSGEKVYNIIKDITA